MSEPLDLDKLRAKTDDTIENYEDFPPVNDWELEAQRSALIVRALLQRVADAEQKYDVDDARREAVNESIAETNANIRLTNDLSAPLRKVVGVVTIEDDVQRLLLECGHKVRFPQTAWGGDYTPVRRRCRLCAPAPVEPSER